MNNVEPMKKPQLKFKSFREWQTLMDRDKEFDPGRDDEGDRRYMVSTGDPAAMLADAEMRLRTLHKRMMDAWMRSDKDKMRSCARAIETITNRHRSGDKRVPSVRHLWGQLPPTILREATLVIDLLGKGEELDRRKTIRRYASVIDVLLAGINK